MECKCYIMKTISLKIDEAIFCETERILLNLKKLHNRYINDAIDYYNRMQKRQILEQKLRKGSELVRSESMAVLKDFENIQIILDL